MSIIHRIAKNTIVLLIAQGISYILAFIYTVLAARYLGLDGYGIITTALAITTIYSVMTDFGTHQLMTREIARDRSKAKQFLVNVSLIKLVLTLFMYGLMALVANIIGYPTQTTVVIYLLGLSVVFSTFYTMLFYFFQAYDRMEFQAIGLIINTLVMLAGVVIAVKVKADVTAFATVYVLSAFAVLIYCVNVLSIVFKHGFSQIHSSIRSFDSEGIKSIVRQSWPIGVMAILVVIRLKVDTIMLSLWGGDKVVGLYNAACRFVDISSVVPAMIVAALFPTLAYLFKVSPQRFDIAAGKAFKYLLFIALPLVFTVIIFAWPLINVTFGVEYLDAIPALQILICAAGVMFISTLTGTLFIVADKQMVSMLLAAVSLLLCLALNVILIPIYSFTGAAITVLFVEIIGFVAGVIILTKMGHKFNILLSLKACLIAVIAVGFLIIMANMINLNIVLTGIISLGVYVIIIYRFGVTKDDIALAKEFFNMEKM